MSRKWAKRVITIGAVSLITIIIAIAWWINSFEASRTRVYQGAMTSELRNLVARQQEHDIEDRNGDGLSEGVYAGDIASLSGLPANKSVVLKITTAGAEGFAAIATDSTLPDQRCVIFVGSVATLPTTLAGKAPVAPATPLCDK